MRIVTVLVSLGMGGAEKQALAIAERMQRRGHTVAVIVLKPRIAEEWPTSLQIVHLDMRKSPGSFWTGLWRARRFLVTFKPELLHSHSFHGNIFVRVLRLSGLKTTAISTIHNIYEGGSWRMLAYRLTDGLSRRTVAVSEAAAERFIRLKAVSKKRCCVITNGTDLTEFVPNLVRRAQMRSSLNADTHFVWFTAGRIVPAKDFPNLLEAFRRVLKEFSSAELWIAGVPRDAKKIRREDGETSYVSLSAMEKGMSEHVRWLGLRRDVPALLDAADGFVLSSAWEGMPLVLGEAMAMEKPIVATDAGGVRELVGSVGTVVPVENHEELAEAMIAMMRKSSTERAVHGRAGRERIRSSFGIEAAVDAWESLYRDLMM